MEEYVPTDFALRAPPMRKPLQAMTLLALCLAMPGCGGCGGLSADLARAARRKRTPEPAKAAQPAAAATAAGPRQAAGAGPATPSAATSAAVQPAGSEPAGPLPAAAPNPVASNDKPPGEMTVVDRRARSLANLERISRALTAYVKKHGTLPPSALRVDAEPLLSWRVLILPELGYPELRARFQEEPWDSKSNMALLDYIPREFQSPERFDNKTNYLAVTGSRSAFYQLSGVQPQTLKDGPDNTVAVVEVDDQYAEPWTRPSELAPALETPGDKLFGLRGEGAFAMLASGRVVLLPKTMQPSRLAALFTGLGGEPIAPATDLAPPTAEPPPVTIATVADDPAAANPAPPAAPAESPAAASPGSGPVGFPGSVPYVADVGKLEVPNEESLARARAVLKELYGRQFQEAKTREEKQQFAKELLAEGPNVEQNAADYHELVRIARDLAASEGDVATALSACDLLEQRFQIDPLVERREVLAALARQGSELEGTEAAYRECLRLLGEAFEGDRYDAALPLCDVALALARIFGSKPEIARLTQRQAMLEDARSLYVAATKALDKVQVHPNDAAANEAVGRYLCLVKNRWEAGLPYLNKSADIRLRGIGAMELSPHRTPHETLALAEQYWDLAGRFQQPQRRGLHLRAVYCYALVQPRLATSLDKVKVSRRLEEAAALYGREEIERVIAPLKPAAPVESLSGN
jgi:hypothetical protein